MMMLVTQLLIGWIILSVPVSLFAGYVLSLRPTDIMTDEMEFSV